MKKILLLPLLLCFASHWSMAQQTVGVLSASSNSTEGYNLIFPHNQEKVFLLDNGGQLVHFWEDEPGLVPGNSVYLLENGNLIKCKRANTKDDPIFAGGAGETVEIINWEGEVLHSYTLNNEQARLHHDVAPLPNGNILMIAWELFTAEEAIEAGRNPETLDEDHILSEMVLEWNPETNQIVWEWHVWDHLVQDEFSTKANFGNPQQNRGKIDINYDEHDGHPDWLHINSISYNPVLDQFALSVPYFNELWIIDHSTTPQEAKTNRGGRSGRGGEILFRFGNDKTYLNTPNDQQLFFQHDVEWVNPNAMLGDDDFGKLALFNNRLPDTTSVGMVINTLDNTTGSYLNPAEHPESLIEAIYRHPQNDTRAYSTGLSSIQAFSNGNILLFAGRTGYGYELNEAGEIVWEYRVPLRAGKPVEQGAELDLNENITFRMDRYPANFAGFEGKDLSPKGLFEEFEFKEADTVAVIANLEDTLEEDNIVVFPNPTKHNFFVEGNLFGQEYQIQSIDGKSILKGVFKKNGINAVQIESLQQGLYILTINQQIFKIMKK